MLLTSDGVHDNLTTWEISDIVAATKLEDLSNTLVDAAIERSVSGKGRAKPDDVTAVVLPVG